ncbi:hypothetical protein BDQ12DRAFT_685995 [Crucibulum laeve]|uniref:UBC core domain-containing protein n=1 Tax=Crucibulum laeve TaxID=68775 RepID=A0A5C3LWV6_9AGAR|nr:hypothetical protein BDQ12DRAFT_685995 [Crucibulum laeve]
MLSDRPRPTKLFQQDIVQKVDHPEEYGIVMRCWHDAEDIPPVHPPFEEPLLRPLQHGEVGVAFITGQLQNEILREVDLKLVDRALQPGDYCKRTIDDVRSGVVLHVNSKARLQHVISGKPLEGWYMLDDVEENMDAELGDYVAYDDWIGQVVEVFDEAIVEVPGRHLVRLPELGSHLRVGDKGVDIIPPSVTGSLPAIFDMLLGNQRSNTPDTVIAIKHTAYAIAWLAVNQTLSAADAENRQRPQRFWHGQDIEKLALIRGRADVELRVGDRVRLKNAQGLPFTSHGQDGQGAGIIHVQHFLVQETETALDVLWQDGARETVKATDIIPYINPDEYDCWPGDHVLWKSEDERRPAIVQSVNPKDRTARILFPETGTTELASVLELDPHGTSDSAAVIAQSASEGLGVRRGDYVFIHREGTTNGLKKPRVPRIGELEAWVRERGHYGEAVVGWKKELADLGTSIAENRSTMGTMEGSSKRPVKGDDRFSWLGEVTDLKLDGSVEVTHPDWSVKVYPLERLTRLYDGMEQLEDDIWDDEGSDSLDMEDDEPVWTMDENGVWQPETVGEDWEDIEEDVDDDSMLVDDDAMEADQPNAADEPIVIDMDRPGPLPCITDNGNTTPSKGAKPSGSAAEDSEEEELQWKRFDVLPQAPVDHAFYSSPPAQPSKSFLGRLTREYRVLSTSLPASILVRAYEDRTDLLRSLIVGSENTPYQDAPFVIDWMLDSNFPNSPPIAHFLSWTNGNGRVNPNLYEEGKVCLSILGTWAGDRNEIWSAARSSLLQAFVSIQGLVLVKEPWYCEPAYDKLRGTEEGIVNSRLYSEKAYVLSRGFVRRALEIPLGDLEEEMNWLYYKQGRLDKVLQDARQLIEKSKIDSEPTAEDRELAVPSLTTGGIITLERILFKLQALKEKASRD